MRGAERGQATVEVALLSVILVLSMFLVVQLTWIAIQKWQFNHFAAYTTRVWSVHRDQGGNEALIDVMTPSLFLRWNLISKDYVKFMWSSSDSNQDVDGESTPGLSFTGAAPLWALYQPAVGDTFSGAFIPSWVQSIVPLPIPSTGLVSFQTFIPMEKEPDEKPSSNRDNDCWETPCETGNQR